MKAKAVAHFNNGHPVSYTHLDVYKRQILLSLFTYTISFLQSLAYTMNSKDLLRYQQQFYTDIICSSHCVMCQVNGVLYIFDIVFQIKNN